MLLSEKANFDYTYKIVNEKELKMTFLPPKKNIYKKAPVYFLIPGGGWHSAERESMIGFSKLSVELLREKGFAVVSIEYRIADEQIKIHDILEDCFDALGYLGEHCEELQIDKENIVTSGHSAGAHLALMTAYADGNLFTKKYDFNNNTIKVVAVAALSPATILYEINNVNLIGFDIDYLFSNPNDFIERKKASPLNYVEHSCPPTILFAGSLDKLIYSESSKILYDKLNDENVQTKFILSKYAGHSFEKISNDVDPSISFENIQNILVDFVLKHITQ
ncbi:alpha/beta hydrolase fold domain-containing protein [Methanobrevibacter sp.]|uniref:alpha/beta hydrolase fold domain-containing protein n=1 Tax=Methanobrevibacter sp. TaxID=66852 RepID=UPI00388FE0D0